MNSDDEIIPSHMFDRIMERFDKLESLMDANDRRRLGKLRPPSHPKPPGRSDQGYSYQHPTRLRSCHEQPPGWPPPPLPPQHSTPADWPTQRRLHAYEKLPPQRPPYFGRDSQAQQQRSDPYRHQQTTHSNGQPWQKDRPFLQRSPSCNRTPQGYMVYDQPLPPGCPPPHTADSREALDPPHNAHAGFDPWQPEYRPSRWIYSGMDSHAMRRNPHTEYHQGQHEYKPSRSIPPPSPPSHCRSTAPPPAAATPSPPLRSDHMPKQPNPALPLELPPSATQGPYRPLYLLPLTAPLLASNPHPQAVFPSSVKKAEVTKVVEGSGGEFGSEKKMGRPKHSKNKKKIGVKNETEAMQLVPLSGGKIPSMNSRDGAVSGARQVVDTVDVFSTVAIKMVFGENGVSDVKKRGRRTITRCAFDPGGDPSPWLRPITLCIASWFPP